jgi:diaminopimelate decarboxylase
MLLEVVRRFGTPTYAYDLSRIRSQIAKLKTLLPAAVEIFYSLKANASLGLCRVMARAGLGADVASAGELVTALAAGFASERLFVSGPDKSSSMLEELEHAPDALLSIDSLSELQHLAGRDQRYRALLRLRPDYSSFAACAAGADSRFGITLQDLPGCREARGIRVVGFHVFSGSQVLRAEGIVHHLRGAMSLVSRAAKILGIRPQLINLGGGLGIAYGPSDPDLDLAPIGRELEFLLQDTDCPRLMIELGRFLVAPAGWYLTTVIAEQTYAGRPAVVVDGGTHQRGDMCGLGLRTKAWPPVVLSDHAGPLQATDVWGCLSLPGDVLIEASPLPPLKRGDILAFPNAGAYGLGASPVLFHGHLPPAEVAFDGTELQLLRSRLPAQSVLDGQTSVCASSKDS